MCKKVAVDKGPEMEPSRKIPFWAEIQILVQSAWHSPLDSRDVVLVPRQCRCGHVLMELPGSLPSVISQKSSLGRQGEQLDGR